MLCVPLFCQRVINLSVVKRSFYEQQNVTPNKLALIIIDSAARLTILTITKFGLDHGKLWQRRPHLGYTACEELSRTQRVMLAKMVTIRDKKHIKDTSKDTLLCLLVESRIQHLEHDLIMAILKANHPAISLVFYE